MTPDLTELDRMLAEFMGTFKCSCGSPACHNVWLQSPANCLLENWHPTSSIAQAFMVAEKINCQFSLDRFLDTPDSQRWRAMFGRSDRRLYERVLIEEYAAAAPLAICLCVRTWLESREK